MLFVEQDDFGAWLLGVFSPELHLSHFNASILNAKRYRAADTGLSRRQLATLDADSLLSSLRAGNRGWRRFSLKELVYFGIISDMTGFGLRHRQLKDLWQAFFGTEMIDLHVLTRVSFGHYEGEYAILKVLMGEQILLLVKQDGYVVICDSKHSLDVLDRFELPFVAVRLNPIVNLVLQRIGLPSSPVTSNVETLLAESLESRLSVKEKQILSIIRNNAYSQIVVTKKDGDTFVVHAGREYGGDPDISPEMVLRMVTGGDFRDVSVTKRNGVIVKVTEVETFKI